jgi:hypothetical protein
MRKGFCKLELWWLLGCFHHESHCDGTEIEQVSLYQARRSYNLTEGLTWWLVVVAIFDIVWITFDLSLQVDGL